MFIFGPYIVSFPLFFQKVVDELLLGFFGGNNDSRFGYALFGRVETMPAKPSRHGQAYIQGDAGMK